jgi:cytochrome c peroxidase
MRILLTLLISSAVAGSLGCSRALPVQASSAISAPASLGRKIFFDASLSASGKISCATCHSPAAAYGPANALAVQLGGRDLATQGLRAVPSLRYTLARTPRWAHPRPTSLAEQVAETDEGPAGGFAWDGRFNTLHEQAAFPLLASSEMASTRETVVSAIAHSPYAAEFRKVYGEDVFAAGNVESAFASVLHAVERFELEDASFHPYDSKFDRYLDGKAALTPPEQRGFALFNDGKRGNCAGCHLSNRGADGSHPLFTDFQFEAIGIPRNPEIRVNGNPAFYDLGLCGPIRTDQPSRPYCGMFKTPTLRNVAARQVFFHNGRFHTLKDALRFYVARDSDPAAWYPQHGKNRFDDLPPALRGNVDEITRPFTHHATEPVWNDAEIDDVIAFLKTLNDSDVAVAVR